MAFLGGLALLGSTTDAMSKLRSRQAIAQAHSKALMQQQDAHDLGNLVYAYTSQNPITGDTDPSQAGAPPPPAGGPPGAPQQAGAPPPGPPQQATGGAPQPATAPPAQHPGAQIANMPQGQPGAQPTQPPGPQGVSFDERFNAAGTGMQQGAAGPPPTPVKTLPVRGGPMQPGKLYNVASPQDQAAISGGQQQQKQQLAQAQTPQQFIENNPQARQILARKPQLLVPFLKAMDLHNKAIQQQKNFDAALKEKRREFDIRDEERKTAAEKAATEKQEKKDAAQKKVDDYKDKIDQLVTGLQHGQVSTATLSKKELGDIEAEAVRRGFNYRAADLAQRAENAYEQTAGRMGAGIKVKVDFSSRELAKAIDQARKTSEKFTQTEFVPFNRLVNDWIKKPFGDQALNEHMAALYTARNAYARLMNPMGVPRIAERAELRFDNMMGLDLGPKALEAQFKQLWKEAQQMQQAAAAMKPGSAEFDQPIRDPESLPTDPKQSLNLGGEATPASAAEGGGEAPPASALQEGFYTTFKGGMGTWTLENGKPKRVK